MENIYEHLTYGGAGEDYNQYILSIEQSAVQDIIQEIEIQEFTFSAEGNGVNYLGEKCEAYTIIAKEQD